MQKLVSVVSLLCAMILTLTACGSSSAAPPSDGLRKIGISQFAQHASLDNCLSGFLQGLEQAGLQEDVDFEVHIQNANSDPALASQIGLGFSAEDVDMMVGIATPSAVACYAAAEDKNIPVIFTAITDPVGAKLDNGNITGTSDVLPVEAQLQLIRKLQPDADSIGLVYTISEPNSVYSVGIYESLAPAYGFTLDAMGVSSQPEVSQAVDTLLSHGVDCITNITDNNVTGVLPSTLEKASDAGIPVYGSEVEQIRLGCVAGAGLDYIQLGIQTGQMAAKILRGESTCADLPYEIIEQYELYINSSALKKLNLTVPEEILSAATDTNGSEKERSF